METQRINEEMKIKVNRRQKIKEKKAIITK